MKFKEFLFHRLFTLRALFLWGNVVLLVLFLLVLGKDQKRGWKTYQREFRTREIARAKENLAVAATEEEKILAEREWRAAKNMPREIRQIWAEEIGAVDRCITCHLGYDPLANSSLTTPYSDQPYSATAATPGYEIHKAHNFEKFGCVVCHGGQGLATEVTAAHGRVAHWEKPLLQGTLLQASCVKCHDNHATLSIDGDVFTSEVIRGKKMFNEFGCIGCHQIGGEGGPISVDLKEETATKPLSRIDFSHTGLPHDEWTLANWIKLHLTKDPTEIVPGDPTGAFNAEPIPPSAMPPYLLSDADADAITAYIMGLNSSEIPPQFRVIRLPEKPVPPTRTLEHGRWVFEKYGCAGCHAEDARGGIRNFNYQYDVTPNLRRAVATYTTEELKNKISDGVSFLAKHDPKGPTPPLYMPAWKDKITGQELDDLVAYLLSIKE